MTTNYELQGNDEGNIYHQICDLIEKQAGTWQSIFAVIGLGGAVLCPLLGILLGTAAWLVVSPKAISVLHIVSIVAFALTVPLLGCGAHCLDLIEKKNSHRSLRHERSSHKNLPLNVSAHRGR